MVVSKIIGREEELAFLEERLDAVSKGETAAVVLEGDAGIGKATLFQAGLRAALAREYRVLSSRPATSEVQLSYAALGELLEGVLVRERDRHPGGRHLLLAVRGGDGRHRR